MRYQPSLLAPNAFMQVFWFCVLSLKEQLLPKIKYDRQIFELRDGGELAIDWLVHPSSNDSKPRNIVVCVPGLSGDSKELYCLCLAKECLRRGLDFVVVNYRGTSGVPLKVSIFSH